MKLIFKKKTYEMDEKFRKVEKKNTNNIGFIGENAIG